MKLRNKETGKVQTCDMVVITDEKIDGEIASLNKHTFIFRSIEQFNDEYEAYKPKEPLIKDEKIRRAVRVWAEAVGTECVEITHSRSHFIRFMSYLADEDELCMSGEIGQIFVEKLYTIAELCGEEEE